MHINDYESLNKNLQVDQTESQPNVHNLQLQSRDWDEIKLIHSQVLKMSV